MFRLRDTHVNGRYVGVSLVGSLRVSKYTHIKCTRTKEATNEKIVRHSFLDCYDVAPARHLSPYLFSNRSIMENRFRAQHGIRHRIRSRQPHGRRRNVRDQPIRSPQKIRLIQPLFSREKIDSCRRCCCGRRQGYRLEPKLKQSSSPWQNACFIVFRFV